MKKPTLITLILLFISFLSFAQENIPQKSKSYKASITLGGGHEIYGILYQIEDSSVILRTKDILPGIPDIATINFNSISFIKIREKKDVGRGVRIGILAGASAGVIIGIISGIQSSKKEPNDGDWDIKIFSPAQLAIGGGIMFGAIGAGVGAGTGAIISGFSVGIKIPIYGNFERFNENKDRLRGHSYIH
jgi:hypothetical protein